MHADYIRALMSGAYTPPDMHRRESRTGYIARKFTELQAERDALYHRAIAAEEKADELETAVRVSEAADRQLEALFLQTIDLKPGDVVKIAGSVNDKTVEVLIKKEEGRCVTVKWADGESTRYRYDKTHTVFRQR